MLPRFFWVFGIIFAPLIFVNGCVAVNNYFVSKPAVDTDGIRITQSGELRLGAALIVIRPVNAILKNSSEGLFLPFMHYAPEQYIFNSSYYESLPLSSVKYFVIELIISPLNNRLVFVPKDVLLRTQEGKEIFPASYKKLTIQRGWHSVYYPKYFAELCQQEEKESDDIDQPLQLAEKKDICLAIKYDVTPPDPRTSFSIQIDGLYLEGKKINIPIIRFLPGSYLYNRA